MKEFQETLYDSISQCFRIDKLYYESKTEHQHLMIFHNAFLGRVMTLDGIVQTTERDEFIYHEMMAHVPLLAHGEAKEVLIVGGGDGAMLREVRRHPGVERIVMVEIDAEVIELARKYLPNHSQGAFEDPRLELVISDGMEFVRNCEAGRFDVIIADSTDPIGPGEVLFSDDFYAECHRVLKEGGVMATQNGVPFFQLDEVRTTRRRMGRHFADQTFYSAAVPTYHGGIMTFGWGSDEPALRQVSEKVLAQRLSEAGFQPRYYTPEIHLASFALPRYLLDALEE